MPPSNHTNDFVIGTMSRLARPGQPLMNHLCAVAERARAFAEPFGLANTAYVCGILHDLGKYSTAFQRYLDDAMKGKPTHPGDVHHAWQGALEVFAAVDRGEIALGLADLVGNIVASHHGELTDMLVDSVRFIPRRIQSLSTLRPDEHLVLTELQEATSLLHTVDWSAVQKEFDSLKTRTPKQPFYRHLAAKMLYSCLVDVDRCDAAGQQFDSTLPAWADMERCLDARLAKFSNQANPSPLDAVRASISSQCATQAGRIPGVFTLSVPTGGGKTLSSLRFAIRHARANGLKRIVYVIPYLSIIDQTANEFRNLFGGQADSWLLEHHSNFILESEDENDEKRYELGTQRWNAPIVLTTMVQFLETVASNRASDLRKLHNMAESVFIFDEIQALPVHCVHLFTQTVNFLSAIGKSSVVLCTATQPHLDKVERPVRLSDSPGLVSLDEDQKALFKRTNLVNLTWEDGRERTFSCAEIASFAQNKVAQGLSTLVILNTKSTAEAVFSAVSDSQTRKFFLSTNLCPAHRLDIIKEIHAILENREKHPEHETPPVLCVSTQLVEAGVDVSFDCIIRAEAGLDSIVQAAGRCNRHGKSPKPCDVFIVRVADDEERLTNLPDIQCGKEIADRVLNREYPDDLDAALDKYYDYRFNRPEQIKKMDCPVWTTSDRRRNPDNPDGTILDWLGLNRRAREAYKIAHDGNPYPGLATAFQSAAEHFSVIEGCHIGVVVPYTCPDGSCEVLALVSDFKKTYDPKVRSKILRKLQPFTISVFANKESDIQQICEKVDGCFYLLGPGNYNPQTGLSNVPGFLNC